MVCGEYPMHSNMNIYFYFVNKKTHWTVVERKQINIEKRSLEQSLSWSRVFGEKHYIVMYEYIALYYKEEFDLGVSRCVHARWQTKPS